MKDLERRVREAVRYFWETRRLQAEGQGTEENRDRGFRAAVTGGRQLDGFMNLLVELLLEAGTPEEWIHGKSGSDVPGFFRPSKRWDLLVVAGDALVATVELKSQVGPSFGNNFNNRTEEALGNATDLWTAYREGVIPNPTRPWAGYLMLLEEASGSTSAVRVNEPHFPVDEPFRGASYADRYRILCERLLRERLYDGTCFLVSDREGGLEGEYREPLAELGFRAFASSLVAHVEGYLRGRG